jgi:tripartite-type tricarboxylate transporter receptor subunit TctC
MTMSAIRWLAPLAAGILASSATAQAPAPYPGKPIRMVVPFPAGAVADTIARILGKPLSSALGQSIVVDNRAGADGTLAADAVIKSAPDGYTFLLGTNGPIIHVPLLRKNPPYDPLTAFTPVSFVGRFTFMLFANSQVPAKSVRELVDYARANPGKLNMGTGNMGAVLLSTQFAKLTGIQVVNVPYKGEAPALPDLVAGRVHIMFYATVRPALGLAKEGRLRPLATVLGQRSALAPDVPTIAEAGFGGVSVTGWAGFYGPANLPQDIALRVSRDLNEALQRAEVREALALQAFEASGSSPEQLAAFVRSDLNMTRALLREAGIEPE